MNEYRVTVGVQYGTGEGHPVLPGMTGDHYVAVIARDVEEARRLAVAVLGTAWSFIYEPGDYPDDHHVPAGCFANFGHVTPTERKLDAVLEGLATRVDDLEHTIDEANVAIRDQGSSTDRVEGWDAAVTTIARIIREEK